MEWVLCYDILFTPAAKNIIHWLSVSFCRDCVPLKKTILLTSMLPFREVPTTGTMKVYPLTLSRHRADPGPRFYLASPKALVIASEPDFLSYTLFLTIFSWVFTVRVLPANIRNADLLPMKLELKHFLPHHILHQHLQTHVVYLL